MADVTQADDGKQIVVLDHGDACLILNAANEEWMLIMPRYEPGDEVPNKIAALGIAMTKLKDPDIRREWIEEVLEEVGP